MSLTPERIISLIQQAIQSLALKTNEYQELLIKRAQTEQGFDVAYAARILELKAEGEPATIIPILAKGTNHVAELKFQFQVAEAMVKASDKSMKNLESALVGYNSILSWEKKAREV